MAETRGGGVPVQTTSNTSETQVEAAPNGRVQRPNQAEKLPKWKFALILVALCLTVLCMALVCDLVYSLLDHGLMDFLV
jgi:hypothetical protein